MKWLSDKSGKRKKSAFLKTIWLQICADLYYDNYIPSVIKWSFPAAMNNADISYYKNIYEKQLPNITPIKTKEGGKYRPITGESITESEAVCSYALTKDFGLAEDILILGVDIGGSTSDILILAETKDHNNNTIKKLIKQSSVRIAAGVFFDAIIRSDAFKSNLYNFHENHGKNINLYVKNIKELRNRAKKETAPFYLNSIFDQLKYTDESFENSDFDLFYSFMGGEAPFVFTIPAFVIGIIVYYSGMLIKNAIKLENKQAIKEIDFMSFGKGGRLLFWLLSYPGEKITYSFI